MLRVPLLAAVGFFINKKSMQNAGGPVFLVGLLSTLLMVGVSYAMLKDGLHARVIIRRCMMTDRFHNG